jgi:pheromone shutdown protein TraB
MSIRYRAKIEWEERERKKEKEKEKEKNKKVDKFASIVLFSLFFIHVSCFYTG